MNDTVQIALISGLTTAAPLVIAQLVNLSVSLRNGKKADDIKKATDGMKDALVAAALKEGHAQGVKDEQREAADSRPGEF